MYRGGSVEKSFSTPEGPLLGCECMSDDECHGENDEQGGQGNEYSIYGG